MLPIFGNEAPIIESSPDLNAKVGNVYQYQIESIDDSNVDLSYELKIYPDGMTINKSSGIIEWIPVENQVGANEVQIEVSDGWKSTIQEFIIEVSLVQLKSISVLPTSMAIYVGYSEAIESVTAFYDNDTSESISKSNCSYQTNNTNIVSVNIFGQVSAKAVGDATITVSYTEDDIIKTDTISVTVKNLPSGGG